MSPVRKDASSLDFDILLDNCRGYFPDITGKVSIGPEYPFLSNSGCPGKTQAFAKDDASTINISSLLGQEYSYQLA